MGFIYETVPIFSLSLIKQKANVDAIYITLQVEDPRNSKAEVFSVLTNDGQINFDFNSLKGFMHDYNTDSMQDLDLVGSFQACSQSDGKFEQIFSNREMARSSFSRSIKMLPKLSDEDWKFWVCVSQMTDNFMETLLLCRDMNRRADFIKTGKGNKSGGG